MLHMLFCNLLILLIICHFEILSVHRELPVHFYIALKCFTIGLCHDLFP